MKTTIVLKKDKDCKHSVRFATDDDNAAVESIYISRLHTGISEAQTVQITVEIIPATSNT